MLSLFVCIFCSEYVSVSVSSPDILEQEREIQLSNILCNYFAWFSLLICSTGRLCFSHWPLFSVELSPYWDAVSMCVTRTVQHRWSNLKHKEIQVVFACLIQNRTLNLMLLLKQVFQRRVKLGTSVIKPHIPLDSRANVALYDLCRLTK